MGIMRFIPPSLRARYMAEKGIPFTKGYEESFDEGYEKK